VERIDGELLEEKLRSKTGWLGPLALWGRRGGGRTLLATIFGQKDRQASRIRPGQEAAQDRNAMWA